MKFKIISLIAAIIVIILQSCNNEELTDLNKDPNVINELNPEFLFTSVLLNCYHINNDPWNAELADGMQYSARYKDVPDVGGKQHSYLRGPSFTPYSGQLNRIMQCMNALNSPDDVNKIAVLKIMRSYAFHVLTDALGDIPYSEAMKGLEGNYTPIYDTQQEVYNGMLKELEDAIAMMNNSKPKFISGDIFYGGDLIRWKKFANTLMLRLAMRLSNVDEATARTWALKAINGGLMSEAGDVAYLQFSSNSTNPRAPYAEYNNPQDPDNIEGGKVCHTLINQFKTTKDPRIYVLCTLWTKVGSVYLPDTIMAHQRGMISGAVFGMPPDFATYSEFSPIWWNRDSSPLIILSPSESYLLLAEAVLRGWYTGITEKEAYNIAVTLAMKQWVLWPEIPSLAPNINKIPNEWITKYLTTGYPYNTTGTFDKRLEQICIQKWLCLIGDDYEIWSNWRRTGYPAFSWKNWEGNKPFPGSVTNGEFFRRAPYPDETVRNKENQQKALVRQGFPLDVIVVQQADALLSRVWWDKP